jgi:hypothetical protein
MPLIALVGLKDLMITVLERIKLIALESIVVQLGADVL